MSNTASASPIPTLDVNDNHILGVPPFPLRNESGEVSPDTSPRQMFRPYSAPVANTPTPNGGNASPERDYYAYMSEPSLSEHGDSASSSNYTPMTPLNGHSNTSILVHMTNSPSNTSLSSLGSPGAVRTAAIARKRQQNFAVKPPAPVGRSLLIPIQGQSSPDSNVDDIAQCGNTGNQANSLDNIISQENNEVEATSNVQQNASDEMLERMQNDLDGLDGWTSFPLDKQALSPSKLVASECQISTDGADNAMTPESQRYLTANESSDGENQEGSSGLSYDSSSQSQEGRSKNTAKDEGSPSKTADSHFLNTPLTTDISKDDAISPAREDTNALLSNTDLEPMDTSPIGGRPGDKMFQGFLSDLIMTTPPRITSFQYPAEEEEDSITPKRKTSGPPSAAQSLSSGSSGRRKRVIKSLSLSLPPENDRFHDRLADDEGDPKERRKRVYSGDKRAPGHRRNRSGDDAAATLLTGSAEWIGMELHKLPLPNQREDDDDNDEDNVDPQKSQSDERIGLNRKPPPRRRSRKWSSGMSIRNTISADDVDMISRSPNALEEGISTRFSPRLAGRSITEPVDVLVLSPRAGLQRSISFSEISASSFAESQFSWISNRTSIATKETSKDGLNDSGRSDTDTFGLALNSYGSTNMAETTPLIGNKHHISLAPHEAIAQGLPNMDRDIEMQEEQMKKIEAYDAHVRSLNHLPHPSPSVKPPLIEANKNKFYPTFTCPRCKTVQREFFTVASAPKEFESPAGYLVSYFVIYMIMSLFIFGMEVSFLC